MERSKLTFVPGATATAGYGVVSADLAGRVRDGRADHERQEQADEACGADPMRCVRARSGARAESGASHPEWYLLQGVPCAMVDERAICDQRRMDSTSECEES